MKLRSALIQPVAAVAGGVVLARVRYAKDAGHAVLRLVPEPWWSALFAGLGVQGAETTSTFEVALVLLVCTMVVAVAVHAVMTALRRRKVQ